MILIKYVFIFLQVKVNKKKHKAPDATDELVQLATKRLKEPSDDCEKIAAAWVVKLRGCERQQYLYAERAKTKFYLRP